jgi:hypothetical protein
MALAGAVLLLAGCPSTTPTPRTNADPLAIAGWHGQPRAVAAVVYMKSTDPAGSSVQATLNLWRAADGRTRLLLTKIDVDVLSALIEPTGDFTAFAPRSGLRTAGALSDARLPAGFADLRLLLGEVCDGPLAPGLATKPGNHGNVIEAAAGGFAATITVDPASDEVREKVLRDAQGKLAYQVRYSLYKAFDDLHRPTKVEVVVGDGSSVVAYLRRFDALGDISAERMRFTIPDTAREVPAAEFLEHLDQ